MGCDIHLFAETKKEGVWTPLMFTNRWKQQYCDWAEKEEEGSPRKEYYLKQAEEAPDDVLDGLYDGRNYDLFAILASVRNGYGFAGCETGTGFIPIAMPKGVPDDVSLMIKQEIEYWEGDGHSHSYFTLQELLDYPHWNDGTTTHYGWVSQEGYKKFKETGDPYPCSGGVSGMRVVHVDNKTMDKIIAGEQALLDPNKEFYTRIEWNDSYKKCADSFYTKSMPELQERADNNRVSYDDIRIVFFFDN